jgi:hypothetical protein
MTNVSTTILPFLFCYFLLFYTISPRNHDRDTHVGAMGWTSVYLLSFSIGVNWS